MSYCIDISIFKGVIEEKDILAKALAFCKNQYEKHMAEMRVDIREINSKLDNIGRHTQNLAVAAMAGIGAVSVSVAIVVASAVTR